MGYDRRTAGVLVRFDSYKKQEKGKAGSHSGVTAAAKKILLSSDSSSDCLFATV